MASESSIEVIMISGLRRSGTSMFKNLLDGHSRLHVCPMNELHVFSRLTDHPIIMPKNYRLFHDKEANTTSNTIFERACCDIAEDKFLLRLSEQGAFDCIDEDGSYTNLVGERLRRVSAKNLSELFEGLDLAFFGVAEDKSLDRKFVFKQVLSEEAAARLFRTVDKSKIIYILRNPYSHLVSARKAMQTGQYRKQHNVDWRGSVSVGDIRRIPMPSLFPEIYRMSLSYKMMLSLSETYPDKFHIVVYDHLLEEPEKTMREVCKFLGIEFEPVLLLTSVLGHEIARSGRTGGSHSSGISTSPLAAWKDTGTSLEVDLINRFFPVILEMFGFRQESSKKMAAPKYGRTSGDKLENKMLLSGCQSLII
jgi:hypothetical protein